MTYQVIINNGQYTFDATTRYYEHDRAEIKDDNTTDFFEHLLNIDGELIGDSPDPATSVQEKWRALRLIFLKETPLRIDIKNLDTGKVEVSYDPANFIGTPKMRELVQVPTDGADQASHIKFQCSFYIRRPSQNNGEQNAKVMRLDRSVEELSEDGQVIRKIWHAVATAKTLDQARALVMAFKPRGVKKLLQDVKEDIDTNTFEATWTWDKISTEGLFDFNERVTITNAGHPWNEVPVVGPNQIPNFHRARYRAGTITVEFEATSDDTTRLSRPQAHFSESEKIIRDRTKEPPWSPPVLIDPVKGIYRAVYYEFWYWMAAEAPIPNHSTHGQPFKPQGVPNGRIGGSQGGRIG